VTAYDVSIYSVEGLADDRSVINALEQRIAASATLSAAEAELYIDRANRRLSIALGTEGSNYNAALQRAVEVVQRELGELFKIDPAATPFER
jgi:hypothetical protein